MEINSSFPDYSNIKVGSVLVGDTSSHSKFGYAVKVSSVSENGNTKTITTEPASMIDIFKQADINIKGDFFDVRDTLHIKKHSSNPETFFESQIDMFYMTTMGM